MVFLELLGFFAGVFAFGLIVGVFIYLIYGPKIHSDAPLTLMYRELKKLTRKPPPEHLPIELPLDLYFIIDEGLEVYKKLFADKGEK